MRVLVFSSPGPGPAAHGSHAAAAAVVGALVGAGHAVQWCPIVGARAEVPEPPAGLAAFAPAVLRRPPRRPAAAAVAAGDLPSEVRLSRELRAHPATAVVQCGVGAGGSPNLPWLAERMGCSAFAVACAAEVLCPRGDLVHASGAPCAVADDPERCRRCVAPSFWGRPSAAAVQNRRELLLASLQACRAVFVPVAADAEALAGAGVPRRLLQVVGRDGAPGALAAAVAALSASRPSSAPS